MRLFAAVRPPDEVLAHLMAALVSVGGSPTGAPLGPIRWTAEENWHLTLAFYGEVAEGAVPELSSRLEAGLAPVPPSALRLRGAGVFSHRTIWVGVADPDGLTSTLVRVAREAGEGCASWQDERVRSRPHLTVGRVVPGQRPRGTRSRRAATEDVTAAPVRALGVYEGPAWTVDEVRLLRSDPGAGRGGGPRYTQIGSFPLGDVAAAPGDR